MVDFITDIFSLYIFILLFIYGGGGGATKIYKWVVVLFTVSNRKSYEEDIVKGC